MLLAQLFASTDGSGASSRQTASPSTFVAIVLFLILTCILSAILVMLRQTIRAWGSRHPWVLTVATFCLGVIVPSIAGLCLEAADVSDLFSGNGDTWDASFFWMLCVVSSIALSWQIYGLFAQFDDRIQQITIEEKERTKIFLLQVMGIFRTTLKRQLGTIRAKARNHEAMPHDVLNFGDSILYLIVGVHRLVWAKLHLQSPNAKLRVALYKREESELELMGCSDEAEANDCVTWQSIPIREQGSICPYAAVRASETGEVTVVQNADDAIAAGHFFYRDAPQRTRISSMVAVPLFVERMLPAPYVLCIDTNEQGFFSQDDSELFRLLSEDMGVRVEYLRVAHTTITKLSA